MTPRERAEGITGYWLSVGDLRINLTESIEKAIIEAIEEEREACALICDEMKAELNQRPDKLQYGRTQPEVAEYLATEIRNRKGIGQ